MSTAVATAAATTAICKTCEDPLVVEIEDDSDDDAPQTVPDDLELSCGCHFHWQCLLDQSADVAMSLKCPSCATPLAQNGSAGGAGPSVTNPFLSATAGAAVLTRYTNEGGVQDALDILPALTEEAYLAANPQARPARAFHLMCAEGDVEGIVDLLRDVDQEGEGALSAAQLVRYQDPLAANRSGLHIAVEHRKEEVVWLLLWIASPLRDDVFPAQLRDVAGAMGLQRPATSHEDDIRALLDESGRSAEAVAAAQVDEDDDEGNWTTLLRAGVLRPGSS